MEERRMGDERVGVEGRKEEWKNKSRVVERLKG